MATKPVVSKEQMNGFRLQLTREKIREVLEMKFLQIFPNARNATQFYNEMKLHEKLFKTLKKNNILTPQQFNILMPSSCETKLADIDESLFILLLRQKNISGFVAPENGWSKEPPHSDRSDEANLVRFQIGRNKMQHSSVSMADDEFSKIFGPLKCALLDYGSTKANINFILSSCLDEPTIQCLQHKIKELEAERIRSNQLEKYHEGFSYKLLPTHEKFIGRKAEIKEIYQHLQNLPDCFIGLNITGIPGVGKTEITRYYCNHYEEEYDNHVLWINGENKSTIDSAFQNIAETIKLVNNDKDKMNLSSEALANRLYNYFGNQKLLVAIDNVQRLEDIEAFLPSSTLPVKPTVLLTSQSKDFGGLFKIYELKTYAPLDAATYIDKHALPQMRSCEEDKQDLLHLLGYHPLALAHAVAYTNINCITLKEYIKLYQTESHDLMQQTLANNLEHRNVMTTFNMAIKKLKQEAPTNNIATRLLNFMAHVDGNEIKKGLLLKLCDGRKVQLNNALQTLLNYSLVTLLDTSEWQEFPEQTVTIHSLVQLASQNDQIQSGIHEEVITKLLDVILQDSEDGVGNIYKCTGAYWWKHIVYMINQKETEQIAVSKIADPNIQSFLREVLFLYCRYDDAAKIFSKVLSLWPQKTIELLGTKRNLAICLQKQGNFTKAIEMFKSVLKVEIEILPINHSITLLTKFCLASCFLANHESTNAMEIYQDLLTSQTEILPINHSDILQTKLDIASCAFQNDYSAEAMKIYQDVLTSQMEIVPTNHSAILVIKLNLANCFREKEDFSEAIKMYEDVLNVQMEVLPTNHADILCTRHNLASCIREKGDFIEAMRISQNVLKEQKAILPMKHIHILNTKYDIACCLQQKGDLNEAIEIYQDVLSTIMEILPTQHDFELRLKSNLAMCARQKGDITEAMKMYQSLLKVQSVAPDVMLSNKRGFAICLQLKGRLHEALQLFQSILKVETETLGTDHIDRLENLYSMATVLASLGNIAAAMNLLCQAGEIMERVYEKDHPLAVEIRDRMNHFEKK